MNSRAPRQPGSGRPVGRAGVFLLLAMLISSTSLAAGAPPARCDHPFHGKTIVLRGNYCPPNVIGASARTATADLGIEIRASRYEGSGARLRDTRRRNGGVRQELVGGADSSRMTSISGDFRLSVYRAPKRPRASGSLWWSYDLAAVQRWLEQWLGGRRQSNLGEVGPPAPLASTGANTPTPI